MLVSKGARNKQRAQEKIAQMRALEARRQRRRNWLTGTGVAVVVIAAAVGIMMMSVEKQAMSYTIKKLAVMSGVSVRTLHFYDEVGLLKPAYIGANGYRHYEEPQLLMLQQILFYRELGFELKRIKEILSQRKFGLGHQPGDDARPVPVR